jgi:methionine-rich copper-binding protein CopC
MIFFFIFNNHKGGSMKRTRMDFKLLIGLLVCFFLMCPRVFAHDTITANSIAATQESDTTFVITVAGMESTNGVTELSCKVWSADNSTDDLKTDVMTKNDDGSYFFNVDMENQHSGDKGMYSIEIFGEDSNGTTGVVGITHLIIFTDTNEWNRFEWNGSELIEKKYRATVKTIPDIKSNLLEANSHTNFKSGYGYSVLLNATVTSNDEITADTSLSGIQNAIITFPEFNYNKGVTVEGSQRQYNRLSEVTNTTTTGNYETTALELKTNSFSATNSRVHFTPLWYPNGNYTVYAESFDAWTPGGMLATTATATMTIEGNVYDDWQVNSK